MTKSSSLIRSSFSYSSAAAVEVVSTIVTTRAAVLWCRLTAAAVELNDDRHVLFRMCCVASVVTSAGDLWKRDGCLCVIAEYLHAVENCMSS